MGKKSFSPLRMTRMTSFPHDLWMTLWEAYGDSCVPPFLEDILHPVTPVMVPSTLVEILPPDAPIASTDLVPSTNAPDSVQYKISCLPTLASWDDFLLDIERLFMESHIEDVGDIIDHIFLLFVEKTTSCIVETDSDTSNSASTNLDMWSPIDRYNQRSQHQQILHAPIAIVIDPTQ